MSLAAEHFKALTENINYQNLKNTEEIQSELRRVITDTQQLTLSQMDDSLSRQLGSILFSHEAGLISALSAINPPEIKWHKTKKLTLSSLLALFGAISGVCALILIFNSGKFFVFLLALLSVALPYFLITKFICSFLLRSLFRLISETALSRISSGAVLRRSVCPLEYH